MRNEPVLLNQIISDGKLVSESREFDISAVEENSFRFLLLNGNNLEAKNWIMKNSELDELIHEQLTADETRPRATVYPEGILINLRGVNLNKDSDPEDMISLRMFAQKDLIIAVVLRRLKALDDLEKAIRRGKGPASAGDFIGMILEMLTDRAEPIISRFREKSIDIENNILQEKEGIDRSAVTELRRVTVNLMRYYLPQKDAVSRMLVSKTNLFTPDDKEYIDVSLNRLRRFVEDLELINERCHLLYDEISSSTAEKLNKNMYVLSVLTAIFLPLGFLTGLFGINLGGMPGAASKYGFWIFSGVLLCFMLFQVVIFKKNKWL